MSEWTVYRCYDAEDWLLYIGCTGNLTQRMRHHSSRSPWIKHLARTDGAERYPDSSTAFAAEANAILREAPAFNIVHNVTRLIARMGEDEMRLEDARPLVGISVQTLRREISAGRLKARFDGQWLVTRDDLVTWIEAAPTEKQTA